LPVEHSALSAAHVVDEFLRLIMIPDPVAASRYTAPDLKILFTGKRAMSAPAECTKFNASRYKWVKKRIERTEVGVWNDGAEWLLVRAGLATL
jgi:hypothetical protein